jgi:hypothetical protein
MSAELTRIAICRDSRLVPVLRLKRRDFDNGSSCAFLDAFDGGIEAFDKNLRSLPVSPSRRPFFAYVLAGYRLNCNLDHCTQYVSAGSPSAIDDKGY